MTQFDITKLDPSQIEDGIPVETTPLILTKRVDFITDDLLYKGQAPVGSPSVSGVWRIVKISFNAEGDVLEEWADGDANFDNVWDDRLTLSYS